MPLVSVGLATDVDTVTVGATGAWMLERIDGGESLGMTAEERWTARPESGTGIASADGDSSLPGSGPVRVTAVEGGLVRVGEGTYRGAVVLIEYEGRVTAVNEIGLEEYLMGVVPREIGTRPETEIEAVKAQAVAARTYAIANLGSRRELGFDYFADTRDQVYGGTGDEDPVANRAILATRGEIVTYAGVPILAYYSSTCGGRTAAIEDSWPGRRPVPYLKSVSDRIPGSDHYYCEPSNRFRWSVSWNRASLLAVLGKTLREYTGRTDMAAPGRVREIAVSRNASGRATLDLRTGSADYTLRMDSIRWVLRTPEDRALNSSALYDVETATAADGDIDQLTVHGGGWGHAIGMCQFGAIGRARAGQKHDTILRTYYAGTEITRLY
jgi:stage II sporulation protein D